MRLYFDSLAIWRAILTAVSFGFSAFFAATDAASSAPLIALRLPTGFLHQRDCQAFIKRMPPIQVRAVSFASFEYGLRPVVLLPAVATFLNDLGRLG
jgi:hypothetical protein